MSHDSKMRCCLVDLYFTLYGRRQPTCLPTSEAVASLYRPQKESDVGIHDKLVGIMINWNAHFTFGVAEHESRIVGRSSRLYG